MPCNRANRIADKGDELALKGQALGIRFRRLNPIPRSDRLRERDLVVNHRHGKAFNRPGAGALIADGFVQFIVSKDLGLDFARQILIFRALEGFLHQQTRLRRGIRQRARHPPGALRPKLALPAFAAHATPSILPGRIAELFPGNFLSAKAHGQGDLGAKILRPEKRGEQVTNPFRILPLQLSLQGELGVRQLELRVGHVL